MNKQKHARKYHEKLHGEYHNLTNKEYYSLGLFIGLYLRRSIYDVKTPKTISRPHIWSAIQGGVNVYVVARDMTLVWEFLKDIYPNVIPVYNINRKSTSSTIEESITDQIKTDKKGLIVDTGFSGSMVKPILNRSGHTKQRRSLLKGLLLSAHSSINSYSELYGISVEGQNIYDNESYRNIITDLEHSPKLESTSEGVTTVSFADRNTRYFAFRLGFFAGLQGLNKAIASKPIKREAMINKIHERRRLAEDINSGISEGLFNVDRFANSKTHFALTDTGDSYLVRREIVSQYDIQYHNQISSGYGNGYNTVYVKRYYSSYAQAKRIADVLNKRYARQANNFSKYLRREKQVLSYLGRIAQYEREIETLKERIQNVGKNITF